MIKFLHTRLRVSNLERSILFYEKLGFKCVRRTEKSPAGNELAFLELSGNEHFLELAYSPEKIPKVPEDLVHTAIGVENIIEYCSKLQEKAVEIWPEDFKNKFRNNFLGEKKIAFVTDPDGYEVEILEK